MQNTSELSILRYAESESVEYLFVNITFRLSASAMKLQPLLPGDDAKLATITTSSSTRGIFWYAGAGWDTRLLHQYQNGEMPNKVLSVVGKNLHSVFTDYSSHILNQMKTLVEQRDRFPICLREVAPYHMVDHVFIEELIPCRAFTIEEVGRIRNRYPNHFYEGTTSSVVPNDEWHTSIIDFSVDSKLVRVEYWHIENSVFWREVCEPATLCVPLFAAINITRQSGQWDSTHTPKESHVWQAIRESSLPLRNRPKVWIADDHYSLRKYWDVIGDDDNNFHSLHFMNCDWTVKA